MNLNLASSGFTHFQSLHFLILTCHHSEIHCYKNFDAKHVNIWSSTPLFQFLLLGYFPFAYFQIHRTLFLLFSLAHCCLNFFSIHLKFSCFHAHTQFSFPTLSFYPIQEIMSAICFCKTTSWLLCAGVKHNWILVAPRCKGVPPKMSLEWFLAVLCFPHLLSSTLMRDILLHPFPVPFNLLSTTLSF